MWLTEQLTTSKYRNSPVTGMNLKQYKEEEEEEEEEEGGGGE